MVVELIGPVVDDGGAVSRTIAESLTRAGLDLRPGAMDQVAGMARIKDSAGSSRTRLQDGLCERRGRILSGVVHEVVANLKHSVSQGDTYIAYRKQQDRKLTECAPALNPMMVTLSGSPPNASILFLTHSNNSC